MNTPMTRHLAAALAIVIVLVTGACVRQQRFRFVPATSACFPGNAVSAVAAGAAASASLRPSLDCRHASYSLAFVEFDQDGKVFDRNEEAAAMKLLDRAKAQAPGGKIITVVYVHGWKNNAAEAAPGGEAKDVERFQSALLELGFRAQQAARGGAPVPVVGVYIGWRGKTLMGPDWYTFISLWGRRNTANHVGDGPDLAPILNRIIEKTNEGTSSSRVLMVGHSFGARVLEHAIETGRVTLYDTVPETGFANPRVDLVLYVNSANDARLSARRVQALRSDHLVVRHPDFDPAECGRPKEDLDASAKEALAARCRDYPLLVAVTSRGDLATKYLLPLANTINSDDSAPLPSPIAGNEFADASPSPATFKRWAAGHLPFLQSHEVREIMCPTQLPSAGQPAEAGTLETTIEEAAENAVDKALGRVGTAAERRANAAAAQKQKDAEFQRRLERALHPVCEASDKDCRFVFRTLGQQPTCFQVDQRVPVEGKPPFNTTAFWIMDVDPVVIKDHGDIWNLSFIEMLGQLIAPRGFFEPGGRRIQLRAASAAAAPER